MLDAGVLSSVGGGNGSVHVTSATPRAAQPIDVLGPRNAGRARAGESAAAAGPSFPVHAQHAGAGRLIPQHASPALSARVERREGAGESKERGSVVRRSGSYSGEAGRREE
eukprot:2500143-Rhodomonas_salina.2